MKLKRNRCNEMNLERYRLKLQFDYFWQMISLLVSKISRSFFFIFPFNFASLQRYFDVFVQVSYFIACRFPCHSLNFFCSSR